MEARPAFALCDGVFHVKQGRGGPDQIVRRRGRRKEWVSAHEPMKNLEDLQQALRDLDGRGYKEYKRAKGQYQAAGFLLRLDHVQGDPYAQPSRFSAFFDAREAGLPNWSYESGDRRRATADFLNRRLVTTLSSRSRDSGSGKSGEIRILRPGQQVIRRSSVRVAGDGGVTVRFRIGMPARGRRIKGEAAAGIVGAAVEGVGEGVKNCDHASLRLHVETVEDAVALRSQLSERGLVAFVAEEATLPRRTGIDDRPLEAGAVPFQPPPDLAVALETPNSGAVRGMGVPEGITLIVGGGYHGKSTLLRAIERGVYDHAPGDGRERVVTNPDAVKVRAEDGRSVAGTDISPFIGALPSGDETSHFRTPNASGSTSQAAAISEALETGVEVLLLDEDTSATNFMIRDARMQRLIAHEHEPIIPFIDRARQMYEEMAVSTVLVVGGSGDYFDVADTVVAMRDYRPANVTDQARAVAAEIPSLRKAEGGGWPATTTRCPLPPSIDASRGRREVSVKVRARDRVEFGTHTVDLSAVEQIVERAQTRAIAEAAVWARDHALARGMGIGEAVRKVIEAIQRETLDIVHPHQIGELAEFRSHELAAFINRLRSLQTEPLEGKETTRGD